MAAIAFLAERMRLGFGVDLMIDQVATGLANRGHDVTVFACYSDGTYENGPYRIVQLAIRSEAKPLRWNRSARSVARGSGLVDLPFDLWFAATPPFFSYLPLLDGRGVAIDCGVSDPAGMPRRLRLNFRITELLQHRRFFPSALHVITISRWLRNQLPPPVAARTVAIPLGADHYPPADAAQRLAIRRRLGIDDEEVLGLYVGRLNPDLQPYKGTRNLLRMHRQLAASHPRSRLVLAGFGDEADAEWIRSEGALPILHAPVDEMPALFAAADLYVTASTWEGFDLPLVEAQRAGRPVVAFRAGAHEEVVDDGRSGHLVEDETSFVAAWSRIVADPRLREDMGAAAGSWAARFRWEDTVAAYDELIERVLGKVGRVLPQMPRGPRDGSLRPYGTSGAPPDDHPCASHPPVSALILNYGIDEETLTRCVTSVLASRCRNIVEVLVVDNGSVRNQDAVDAVEQLDERVWVARLGHNFGFAGGMNRGVALCRGEWILILNNDTEVHPLAIDACAEVLDRVGPGCLAAVPKLLLRQYDGVIDAVGNAVDPMARAFNQGVGQVDVGQFDRSMRVFGPCFAAGLFRRKAFDPDIVGPLDPSYFMYYEDVDWNWRANLWGYQFVTAPGAEVYHDHSKTTREQPHDFKVNLIHRNLITTAVKNMPRTSLVPALRHHLGQHLRAAARGGTGDVSFRILAGVAARFPEAARRRRWTQFRKVVADADLEALAQYDPCLFDDCRYAPKLDLSNLAVAYRRKVVNTGESADIADWATFLSTAPLASQPGALRRHLLPLLDAESESARRLVRALDPGLCPAPAAGNGHGAG